MNRKSHFLFAAVVAALASGPVLAADFAVPSVSEPGTLGLLAAGVGVAALVFRGRRKK